MDTCFTLEEGMEEEVDFYRAQQLIGNFHLGWEWMRKQKGRKLEKLFHICHIFEKSQR